ISGCCDYSSVRLSVFKIQVLAEKIISTKSKIMEISHQAGNAMYIVISVRIPFRKNHSRSEFITGREQWTCNITPSPPLSRGGLFLPDTLIKALRPIQSIQSVKRGE